VLPARLLRSSSGRNSEVKNPLEMARKKPSWLQITEADIKQRNKEVSSTWKMATV